LPEPIRYQRCYRTFWIHIIHPLNLRKHEFKINLPA